jgi:hypothetical protein
MRPISVTVGPLVAPSATNIRSSSGVSGAGALVLNGSLVTGGVAILDTPRQILFTTTADEHTKTITITGTNWSGAAITEVLTLPSSATTKATALDFKTASSFVASAALTGSLSIGTNGVAGSAWVQIDPWGIVPVSVQVTVSGTVAFDIEVSNDDPNSISNPVLPYLMAWTDAPDTGLVNKTGVVVGSIAVPFLWARLILNSQTNPGYATATFIQPSVSPP